jgi:uncharacterized protein (TIGR02271 family)
VTGRSDSRSGEGRRRLSAGRAVAVGAMLGTAAQVAAHLLRQRSGEHDRATRQRTREYDRATQPRSGEYDRATRQRTREYDRATQPRSGEYDRATRLRSREYDRATQPWSGEYDRATRAAAKPKPHVGSGDAMTRSEEELKVRTVRRRRGRVRLRKYVVTEEVQRTIPLRREEIRVEEEPISSDDAGRATEDADDSSEDEIVLYKEIPVIEKRVVPAERVRIVKDVRSDEAQISEKLRKERIDVETDPER